MEGNKAIRVVCLLLILFASYPGVRLRNGMVREEREPLPIDNASRDSLPWSSRKYSFLHVLSMNGWSFALQTEQFSVLWSVGILPFSSFQWMHKLHYFHLSVSTEVTSADKNGTNWSCTSSTSSHWARVLKEWWPRHMLRLLLLFMESKVCECRWVDSAIDLKAERECE